MFGASSELDSVMEFGYYYVDAAYCHKRTSTVCLSVGLSAVCHDREPCKSG